MHAKLQELFISGCGMQGAQEDIDQNGFEGLFLGGNYVAGVALGRCVEYAYEYAGNIAKHLETYEPAGAKQQAAYDKELYV